MRKYYSIFISLILISLISCVSKPKNDNDITKNPESVEKNIDKKKTETTKKSIYTEKILQKETDYITTDIKYPVFEEKPLLNKYIENSILNYYNSFSSACEKNWKSLKESFEDSLSGSYSTNYSISTTKDYTTVLIETWIYEAGAPHGNIIFNTYCYNENTKSLEKDIQKISGLTYEEISQKSRTLIKKELLKKDSSYYDEEWVNSGTEANPGNFENFLLFSDKINFFFEPYTVAPYAAGVVEISITTK